MLFSRKSKKVKFRNLHYSISTAVWKEIFLVSLEKNFVKTIHYEVNETLIKKAGFTTFLSKKM